MKSFVISQLMQAVLVVVVTIITVRYTQLGSLGISQQFKAKLKATTLSSIRILIPLAFAIFSCLGVYVYTLGVADQPLTRSHVFFISFWMIMAFDWLNEFGKSIRHVLIKRYEAKLNSSLPPNVQQ